MNKEKKESKFKKLNFKFNKNTAIGIFIGIILGAILFSNGAKLDEYESQINSYEKEVADYKQQVESLTEKVEEAAPWFEMEERERKEAEEKLAAEKAAEEEAKRKEQEEKEKKGYDTGITYNQLARTPDDYIGEKVKFSGKVIQVLEGDDDVQIRFAVGGNYDKIIYGTYDKSLVKSRVLEDDYITIRGISAGLLTYESTMGASITIPSMVINGIEY